LQPHKTKNKKNLTQNCFIFRLFLFFLLFFFFFFNPSASSDTYYYSLSPAPDALHFCNSINPATSQTDFATNEFYKRAAKNVSRAEDSDTRSYSTLVASRLYLVALI
jgi:hypothetical protein